MPALSVGNPLLSEKLENMSSTQCYEGYILCFISIIPSPLTSCPMPLRGTVNLILQYSPLHLLPLSFFSSLLFFLARTFCCYRSKTVPGLIFAGGEERRLGLGLPSAVNRDYLCAVLFWRIEIVILSLNWTYRLPHLCNCILRMWKICKKGGFSPLSIVRVIWLYHHEPKWEILRIW